MDSSTSELLERNSTERRKVIATPFNAETRRRGDAETQRSPTDFNPLHEGRTDAPSARRRGEDRRRRKPASDDGGLLTGAWRFLSPAVLPDRYIEHHQVGTYPFVMHLCLRGATVRWICVICVICGQTAMVRWVSGLYASAPLRCLAMVRWICVDLRHLRFEMGAVDLGLSG